MTEAWNAREIQFLFTVQRLSKAKDDFVTALELKRALPEFHSINDEIEKHDRWGYLETGKDADGFWGRRLSLLGLNYIEAGNAT